MDKVSVEGIRLYAYHGCLDEEGKIGTEYIIDVHIWGNIAPSFASDDLNETMDYVTVNQIVERHVLKRAKLIETVAHRILKDLFYEMSKVAKAQIKLSKMQPPINGDVKSVSIELMRQRSDIDMQ